SEGRMTGTTTTSDVASLRGDRHPGLDPGAPIFVWGIWALMVSAALTYIAWYGSDVPYWDEWILVPALTGRQPLTLEFLWAQHNEHRIPLPKLLLVTFARLSHHNFRTGMVANVIILGLTAAAMIRAARKLRGRTSFSDAFFPMAMLHWGHYDNFV